MLSWNKLGMFDFLFLCTFGSWRRRWCVTNILIPRRLQRVRSRKADTIFSSVMCFLFFYHYHLFSIRYPSCCPWSPGPASPSRPCGLPSGFWRQGVAYLLMEIWRRSLTWVWRSTSTRRPDSKVPGSHWGCGRLGCIVRAVGDIGFFCISSQKLKAKWSHLKMVIWLWLNE